MQEHKQRMGWKGVPIGEHPTKGTEYKWIRCQLRDIRQGDRFIMKVGGPVYTAESHADDEGVIAQGLIEF